MSASPAIRSLRAAVFAVLCVLLAAGGHELATGEAPPLWVDAAGCLAVFAAGFLLGGRERSLVGIGAGMLTAQAGLHMAFETLRPGTAMAMPAPHAGAATVMPGPQMAHAHGALMEHVQAPHMTHAMASHATGAHVAAALLATWWLRRGEAALWSLSRRTAALVQGLAAWWRTRTGPVAAPTRRDVVRRNAPRPRPLRQLLLRHAVSRRGPPAGLVNAP